MHTGMRNRIKIRPRLGVVTVTLYKLLRAHSHAVVNSG